MPRRLQSHGPSRRQRRTIGLFAVPLPRLLRNAPDRLAPTSRLWLQVPQRVIPRRLTILLGLVLGALAGVAPTAGPLGAQGAPVIETVVPFDAEGRITVLTPMLVSRLRLSAPAWPVGTDFREARLYRTDSGGNVLAVLRTDGTTARYALSDDGMADIRRVVDAGLLAQGPGGERVVRGGTSLEVSQPAGNAFVRNQALLGLVAYGPASAALLSGTSGAAAAGAYFFAAGTSFFVAANTVKNRTVTRAQASRSAHGGTRGALTGLAVAAMADADGGPAWGAPILAGAIGGTIVGYHQARGLSDGEAASAGLFADLGALTTIGLGGTAGAFRGREYQEPFEPGFPERGTYTRTDNSLRGPGKVTIGAAIGAQVIGYALGPRYARRAAYNVTQGDASMVFTGALIGAGALSALRPEQVDQSLAYGLATAGIVAGGLFADRVFVRKADRTGADGTLAQLGAFAGALMGAGVGAMADANGQVTLGLASAGGLLGLLAADGIIGPAKDAGPLRGVMKTGARATADRVFVSLGPVSSVRITF